MGSNLWAGASYWGHMDVVRLHRDVVGYGFFRTLCVRSNGSFVVNMTDAVENVLSSHVFDARGSFVHGHGPFTYGVPAVGAVYQAYEDGHHEGHGWISGQLLGVRATLEAARGSTQRRVTPASASLPGARRHS